MAAAPVVGDPRFFTRTGPHDLARVVQVTAAIPRPPPPPPAGRFTGVAPLQTAGATDVSFLDNRRYADLLASTQAGAVILHPELADRLPPDRIGLLTTQPYLAWARLCALFFPDPPPCPGRHPTAAIDPAAAIHASAELGPFAVVAAHAVIGPDCRIGAHAVIGPGVVLGAGCVIGAHVSLSHAVLGDRVRILPGARIGQEGFGFAPDGAGGYLSVPQLGRVILEHDVEIGANTTIDRGSMRDTVIGAGTRLDNLVQIGHNVQCGQGCVIVAQAGISGSTILGDHVMMAAQAGLAGHLHVGAQARIGAQAGVMADIPAQASVMGSPSQPARDFFREVATLRRQVRPGNRPRPSLGDDAAPIGSAPARD